jgi:hypothetical protein
MADTKISALPASTTPLAGTEVLPIVQSGATKQVSVANLTAGRALSATQLTLTAGNLIVASGQGIDFSATSGTGTSELLNDYEEGTWTPVDASGAGLSFSNQAGGYTKIGRMVYAYCRVGYPATLDLSAAAVGGLPFTIQNDQYARQANITYSNQSTATFLFPIPNAAYGIFFNAAGVVTNAQMSGSDNWLLFTYPV